MAQSQHVRLFAISAICWLSGMSGLVTGAAEQRKKHDDNSWLLMCEMFHTQQPQQQSNESDKFVINAIVSPTGCQLTCVVLQSSSSDQRGFFDKTVTHQHNLNDGIYCKRDHVCKAGTCTLELTDSNSLNDETGEKKEKTGIVVIDVLDAYVPQKDTLTHSDAFVRVVVKSPVDGDVKVGRTKVVWDNDRPVFNKTVKIENVSILSTVFFEIFDRDMMGPDDYIAGLYAALKSILKQERNHKAIQLNFLSQYFLRVKISWIANES